MNQRKAGVILSYLSMGAHSVLALVYVPMLLHFLTKDQYGIYQLMGAFVAYLALLNFGLGSTTTRYLSQAYAKGDEGHARQVIATSHALYTTLSFIALIIGGIFYMLITPIYGQTLSVQDIITAKQIFLLMLFNVWISICCQIFPAVINAHERFFFLRGVNLLQTLIQPFIVFCVLKWKASVFNLVLVQVGCNIAVIFLNYLYAKTKLNAQFFISWKNIPMMKELVGFSVFIFLHAVMDQVYWKMGQLVLGAVSGTTEVVIYSIAIQLTIFTIFLPATMSGVFLPQLSAMVAKEVNLTEIDKIFCKVGRLQFTFMVLLIIGFAFLGRSFLVLWIGPGYETCYWITLILMGSYLIDVTQNVGVPILQALKKHAFRAYVYLAMAVLNIGLCIPLAKQYGEIGCAIATAVCLILGTGFAINWYFYHIGLNLKLFFRQIGQICCGIIPAILLCFILFRLFPLQTTWFSFLWHGSILTLVYGVCIWFLAFNTYEKNLFLDLLYKLCPILEKKKL